VPKQLFSTLNEIKQSGTSYIVEEKTPKSYTISKLYVNLQYSVTACPAILASSSASRTPCSQLRILFITTRRAQPSREENLEVHLRSTETKPRTTSRRPSKFRGDIHLHNRHPIKLNLPLRLIILRIVPSKVGDILRVRQVLFPRIFIMEPALALHVSKLSHTLFPHHPQTTKPQTPERPQER